MRALFGAALAGLFLSGGSAATIACSPCRVGGQDEIVFEGGSMAENGAYYETGGPNEEMLHFPQGRTYRLMHGLGSSPMDVSIYLSFRRELSETGDKDDKVEPNNLAPSAGNQAVIEEWNAEYVQVRNDTCTEFYLRVVIVPYPGGSAEGAAGSAGAAGN